ncbi:MAG: pilus assembly protein PilP [Thauera phenolivorans]|uniref:Pilus assembly protein PilP n=1 Tax=Thauera phenolivorans TaxID=1792543 RepID=A0A7X7LW12_9RHOO|nr:pilus assembly protein PilP [Thauera phenolivorans]
MNEQAGGMRGAVKPLPEIKPFPVVDYGSAMLVEPFQADRIEPERQAARGGLKPDLQRRREPLESFPLESLKMVGMLERGRASHALIQADAHIHQVRVGNHMGQNFGVVTAIGVNPMGETAVTLKELVEDINGDWVERTSSLLLQERQEAGK